MPVLPFGASCLQIAFAFRAAVNHPVRGGPLSVFPLFHLFAEFSQIDDFAHLCPLRICRQKQRSQAQTAHLRQLPSPLTYGEQNTFEELTVFFSPSQDTVR